jgi:hypothetical protein
MQILTKSTTALFCLLSVLWASASATPLVGQPISIALNLSTDWKAYNIPLPSGGWRVAAVVKEAAQETFEPGQQLSVMGSSVNGVYEHISLVQIAGGSLKGLVLVTAKVKTSIETQTPDICRDSADFAYSNTYGARRIVTKCLTVSSLQQQRGPNAQLLDATVDWLTTNAMSLPPNMIGFQYAQVAQPRRYLSFGYYVNAATWGLNRASSQNGASAWSKRVVGTNAVKSRFVTRLTAFGQQYTPALRAAAEGRGAYSAATLRPFTFDNISANDTMPIGTSKAQRRLAEIRATCQSIGFKDKTRAMQDCIKELLSR